MKMAINARQAKTWKASASPRATCKKRRHPSAAKTWEASALPFVIKIAPRKIVKPDLIVCAPDIVSGRDDHQQFWGISYGEINLQFNTPLTLQIECDDAAGVLRFRYPRLDIDVYGRTREELRREFERQVAVLWHEYALERDDVLSESALDLKRKLRLMLEEAGSAT